MSGADFVRRRKNYPIRTVDLPRLLVDPER